MQRIIDQSTTVRISSFLAILFVAFFTQKGTDSEWLLPLVIISISATFAGSAYCTQKFALLEKHVSRKLFWLSVFLLFFSLGVIVVGGT